VTSVIDWTRAEGQENAGVESLVDA